MTQKKRLEGMGLFSLEKRGETEVGLGNNLQIPEG